MPAGAAELSIIVSAATSQANMALRDLFSNIEGMSGLAKTALVGMTAAVVAAGVAFSVNAFKAAEEARIGLERLTIVLRNVGVEYGQVSAVLSSQFQAVAKKTNYSVDEQIQAFGTMVGITGDYTTALQYTNLVADLAAYAQMNLNTSAQLVARAIEGNTRIFSQYGIQIDENVSSMQALQELQLRVAGSAEALISPTTQLGNAWREFSQIFGEALTPALVPIINGLTDALNYTIQNTRAFDEWDAAFQKMTSEGLISTKLLTQEMLGFYPAHAEINRLVDEYIKKQHEATAAIQGSTDAMSGLSDATWKWITVAGATPGSQAGGWQKQIIAPSGNNGNWTPQSQNITVNVEGSVTTDDDLVRKVREGLNRTGFRNAGLELP